MLVMAALCSDTPPPEDLYTSVFRLFLHQHRKLGQLYDRYMMIYYHGPSDTQLFPQIYRQNDVAVAHLDWTLGNHLGMVTIGRRHVPMTYFIMEGTVPR